MAEKIAELKVKQYLERTTKPPGSKERPKSLKLLDYFLSSDLSFATESRASRRAGKATVTATAAAKYGDGSKEDKGEATIASSSSLPAGRPSPEDGWTTVRRVEVNERSLRSVKQNLDLKRDAHPDIFQVPGSY